MQLAHRQPFSLLLILRFINKSFLVSACLSVSCTPQRTLTQCSSAQLISCFFVNRVNFQLQENLQLPSFQFGSAPCSTQQWKLQIYWYSFKRFHGRCTFKLLCFPFVEAESLSLFTAVSFQFNFGVLKVSSSFVPSGRELSGACQKKKALHNAGAGLPVGWRVGSG